MSLKHSFQQIGKMSKRESIVFVFNCFGKKLMCIIDTENVLDCGSNWYVFGKRLSYIQFACHICCSSVFSCSMTVVFRFSLTQFSKFLVGFVILFQNKGKCISFSIKEGCPHNQHISAILKLSSSSLFLFVFLFFSETWSDFILWSYYNCFKLSYMKQSKVTLRAGFWKTF